MDNKNNFLIIYGLMPHVLAVLWLFFFWFFSKEFIPLNRPTPTSLPIHVSWSPRVWFLPCTFELRRDVNNYGFHLLASATNFMSHKFCWTSVPARRTRSIIGTGRR